MNVLIIDYAWNKSWMPLYLDAFKKRGHQCVVWDGKAKSPEFNPDVVFCTWGDRDFTGMFPNARHVMMMRRFEFFHSDWARHNWNRIAFLFCCNPWIARQVANAICGDLTSVLCVRNPIDQRKWTFKERSHGEKIGMVCRVFPVKNLPLAVQILKALPLHELHIAGPIHDANIATYLQYSLGKRVKFYGNLNREGLDQWWEDKNYCLSTSISEGDPMCVLEAMSKGIKPIIHNWPGADEMYQTFDTVDEALKQISGPYESTRYRQTVADNNPISNIDFVVELATKNTHKEK